MLTNTVCTVVRQDGDGVYSVVGTHECMWQETEAYETKKYGEGNADKAAVYIPDTGADVKKYDYICEGCIHGNIDVSGMLTVISVTRYKYGSEEMRHIRVGAR